MAVAVALPSRSTRVGTGTVHLRGGVFCNRNEFRHLLRGVMFISLLMAACGRVRICRITSAAEKGSRQQSSSRAGELFKRNDEREEGRTEGGKTPGTAGGCGDRERGAGVWWGEGGVTEGSRSKRSHHGRRCVCTCLCACVYAAKTIVTGDKENRNRMEKLKERKKKIGEEFQFLLENYLPC